MDDERRLVAQECRAIAVECEHGGDYAAARIWRAHAGVLRFAGERTFASVSEAVREHYGRQESAA